MSSQFMYTPLPFYKENHKLWDFLPPSAYVIAIFQQMQYDLFIWQKPFFHESLSILVFHIFPIFCATKHAKTFLQLQIYQFQTKFCATLTHKHFSKNVLFLD